MILFGDQDGDPIQMRCDPTPACGSNPSRKSNFRREFGSSEKWKKTVLRPPRMVARGGRTDRGGRSRASIVHTWELRLAEAADYFLRAVLRVPPRPEWGPLWILPASRAEVVSYLTAVANSVPEGEAGSETRDE